MTAVVTAAPVVGPTRPRPCLSLTPTPTTWVVAAAAAADGELDIGELAGPYVAADALARRMRADGEPVVFTSAIDEYHPGVLARALRSGREPAEVAESFGETIAADWAHAQITLDGVVRVGHDAGHRARVAAWFRRLYAAGLLTAREGRHPYCASCELWGVGRLVVGECPGCGAPCGGGPCAACLRPNDPEELADPHCARCGGPTRPRALRRLFFPLEPHHEVLRAPWAHALPATSPAGRGPAVPVDGFAGQRVDPQFAAALAHLVAAETIAEDGPYEAVHFLRRHDTAVHLALVPALLRIAGLPQPARFHINDPYVTAAPLWALDALTAVGSDALRRHVLLRRPDGAPVEHRQRELAQGRRHLVGRWNGWLGSVFAAARSEHGGLVPDAAPGGVGWEALTERLRRIAPALRTALGPDHFAAAQAVTLLDEVVDQAVEFGRANTWEAAPVLAAHLAVAGALSAWAWPVMPHGAARLATALGVPVPRPIDAAALCPPTPGARLEPPTGPLFGL
ncbi:class I tRNA ligase family protein [Streptomyces xanthii]|uniref:Class I tRNA ligase family protein n=1 Tax=Streptomyces xanthii TaxID=2768069 RepID=A0A7H1BKS5_9ACTN|nr:class I tRNA ligase family protein [Streptomyces xanthii]QNS09330.1 class I tRNA ligase family protein [Streptomyces xanthii]